MRTRITAAGTVVLMLAIAGCDTTPKPDPAAGQVTAQLIVDRLSDLYPLPGPRDNTDSCNTGKEHPNDCLQLISTDPVSVYELKTETAAAHWTKQMGRAGKNKAVQAGRFMLLWKADYPSDPDAVAEMTEKAQTLARIDK